MLLVSSCLRENQLDSKEEDVVAYNTADSVQSVHKFTNEYPYSITLEKVNEYSGTDSVFIPLINKFTVGSNGTVFISNQRKIEVFDSDGTHIKSLGRDGRGPGEFNNMVILSPALTENMIYAYDDILNRINIFRNDSLDLFSTFTIPGKKIRRISGKEYIKIRESFMLNDSLVIVPYSTLLEHEGVGGKRNFVLLNLKSEVLSEQFFSYVEHPTNALQLFQLVEELPIEKMNVPTSSYFKFAVDREGFLYTTQGEEFLIEKYDSKGELVKVIKYPFDNSRVNREEIIASNSYNGRGKRLKQYDFPKKWPAIHQFFVDDKLRIWVATIIDDNSNYEWWVLDAQGEILTKFLYPGERLMRNTTTGNNMPIVQEDHFYIVENNANTSFGALNKYKISLTPRNN